jgi:uncharacterized protein (DUF924 family)
MPEPLDTASARQILDFWFSEKVEPDWFRVNPALDQQIKQRFGDLYELARAGELSAWLESGETALALVILLDQFPRNMFRGTPRAFESDEQARGVSRVAIDRHFDRQRSAKESSFFYLPLMHSEDLLDQVECVRLYRRAKDEENLKYAIEHHDIIARFGRFPHRNRVLGRRNSDEEEEFLKTHEGF